METYDIGDLVRIGGSFQDALTKLATDPTTLKLAIKNPAGVETVYVLGDDAAIVRDGTGEFHFDLLLTASETWHYRWRAAGAVTAAEEGFIVVSESAFLNPMI
jgi:hypothetical protein